MRIEKSMKIIKKNVGNNLNFFSSEMCISEEFLSENHLKLTYQKQLISNLDSKHKDWSKHIGY